MWEVMGCAAKACGLILGTRLSLGVVGKFRALMLMMRGALPADAHGKAGAHHEHQQATSLESQLKLRAGLPMLMMCGLCQL